jgi:imidazolonepropionase-like amidohydrolase
VAAGVDTIEHGNLPSDEIIGLMAERGTYWVPTVSVNRGLIESEKAHLSEAEFREHIEEKVRDRELSEDRIEQGIEYFTRSYVEAQETFQRMREAGVRIACGTDVDASTERPNSLPMYAARNELKWFVEFGMTPEEAIAAATRNSAEACGLLKRTGTLEEGKLADLLVLESSPLEDIGAVDDISLVMKEGEIVRGLETGVTK